MLADRQLKDIDINITPGTAPVVDLMKSNLGSGSTPSWEEILSVLQWKGRDAVRWREFLSHLESRHYPTKMRELSQIAYVFKTIRSLLEQVDGRTAGNNGKNLIIQVDNISEWKILDRPKDFLDAYYKKLPDSTEQPILVGLFPMQEIFIAGPGRPDLHIKETSAELCSVLQKIKSLAHLTLSAWFMGCILASGSSGLASRRIFYSPMWIVYIVNGLKARTSFKIFVRFLLLLPSISLSLTTIMEERSK